ncbi:MAG: M23 family metallopeptidase [Bacteroidales bacterium]|nr:M23 family metallopeptidase [Bacteroidales bacterium]
MKRSILLTVLIFAAVLAPNVCFAADTTAVIKHGKPLDLPMSFAASYGELRHDHFHGGIDFRTGGKTGDPIHSIKDGYVSRISVSTTGYGNGLYITHPDGTMSVYGHMLSFRSDISERVLQEQYDKRSFSVNILLGPDEFPVKMGDIIGKVGNTGSSVAPHLHMEVRRDDGNTPFNFFREGYYSVPDTQTPVIQRIAVYAYEDSTGIPVSRRLRIMSGKYSESVISVPAKSYLGIDAIDKMEGTTGRLGVEKYRVLLDGEPLFELNIGDFNYDIDKYIRSTVAAGESGMDFIKTQVDPGNLLAKTKITAENGGIIELADYERHRVTVEASDIFGNITRANLYLRRDDSIKADAPLDDNILTVPMLWYVPNSLVLDGISVSMPLGALYNNVYFQYGKIADADTSVGFYSPVWQLGDDRLALHEPFKVTIPVGYDEALTDKMILARVSSDGKLSGVGGVISDGMLTASVRSGRYCVARDTIAPVLKPAVQSGGKVSGNTFRITATDDMAGIAKFEVLVDGEWTLASMKNSSITVYLSEGRVRRGSHDVKVTVYDAVGNCSESSFKIVW